MVNKVAETANVISCSDPEGKGGLHGARTPPTLLENLKAIGFLSRSNTGPDSLENHKATQPTFKKSVG